MIGIARRDRTVITWPGSPSNRGRRVVRRLVKRSCNEVDGANLQGQSRMSGKPDKKPAKPRLTRLTPSRMTRKRSPDQLAVTFQGPECVTCTAGKYSNLAVQHRPHATRAGLRPAPTTNSVVAVNLMKAPIPREVRSSGRWSRPACGTGF